MNASPIKQQVAAMMRRVRQGRLPASDAIVAEAFDDIGIISRSGSPNEFRLHFDSLLTSVWRQTLVVLERYEHKAYSSGIPAELASMRPQDVETAAAIAQEQGFPQGAHGLLSTWYPYLREAFLSVSQSRKTRGGKDFELQFGSLLDFAAVRYEKKARAYRVDFMMPSDAAFRANRTVAAIASLKRTLRERWREVVAELVELQSPNIFLVTADEDVGAGHVRSICDDHNLHLVVWDRVKDPKFRDHPLVLGYSSWINNRMPAIEQFWPQEGFV